MRKLRVREGQLHTTAKRQRPSGNLVSAGVGISIK